MNIKNLILLYYIKVSHGLPYDVNVGLRIENFYDKIAIDVYTHDFFDERKVGMMKIYNAVIQLLKEHSISASLIYKFGYKIEIGKQCYNNFTSLSTFLTGVKKRRFAERGNFIIEDINSLLTRISINSTFTTHEFIRFSMRNRCHISGIFVNNILVNIYNSSNVIARGSILDIYFDKRFY